MHKLVEIFSDLKNNSSRKEKESILERNKDVKVFRHVLEFVYNPFIVTGISTRKLKKKVKIKESEAPDIPFTISGLTSYLLENNSGRDIDIYVVQQCINQVPTEEGRKLLSQIVTKDLKVGITAKTINKVYGKGTIPEFDVMLAETYQSTWEKHPEKLEGKTFYVTQKLDGNRCIAFVEEDGVKFFTRKGQAILGMVELEEQFSTLPHGVYDGELLLINKNNLPSDELFRATQKVVRKDGEKKDLEFYIFDTITVSEFHNGKSKSTYEQRRNTLDGVFADYISNLKNIHVLPVLYKGDDQNIISSLMKYALEKGWEGLMLNIADGLYQTKRTPDLLKVKEMKSADLLCVSFEKAIDGQFKDLLARVNVEYKGNLVGVGSGFTIEERRYFTDNPDEIVGKIIEVQYFEESKDQKTGAPSLRFPVFKGVRHDKTIDDVNYE